MKVPGIKVLIKDVPDPGSFGPKCFSPYRLTYQITDLIQLEVVLGKAWAHSLKPVECPVNEP